MAARWRSADAADAALLSATSQSPENRFKDSGDRWPVSIGINAAYVVLQEKTMQPHGWRLVGF